MTTPTLKELAEKHEEHFDNCPEATYSFTLDQIRALITEAVGIVAGEPVALYDVKADWIIRSSTHADRYAPLHIINMGRLK